MKRKLDRGPVAPAVHRHGSTAGPGTSGNGRAALEGSELDEMTEEERRALRASRFAAAAPVPTSAPASATGAVRDTKKRAGTEAKQAQPQPRPRLAHPGGTIATNKAAALQRFLERRLSSGQAAALDPRLVEQAVRNAQRSLNAPANAIKHVESFDNGASPSSEDEDNAGAYAHKPGRPAAMKSHSKLERKKPSKHMKGNVKHEKQKKRKHRKQ